MAKGKGVKRKRDALNILEEDLTELPATTRPSDEPITKKVKWINKQRVLVFASRGISHRDRHLMEDLKTLMPHSRTESKMERRENLAVVNELCEMKNCNKCIMFEGRLKHDLYMWVSNVPNGPSAKFLIENVYTMAELKLTGNCLKGARPLLSFDDNFNSSNPHYSVLKELFIQVFGVPHYHPKSQPFNDHVMTFSVLDNRIWFRNYQILSEDGALAEIGPRFVMNPVKIFDGSFGGPTLWENPFYVSPTKYRQQLTKTAAGKYLNRVQQKVQYKESRPESSYQLNPIDNIFAGDHLLQAQEITGHNAGGNVENGHVNVGKEKLQRVVKGQKKKIQKTLKRKRKNRK